MKEEGERRRHFRGKPRPGRRVEVRYRTERADGSLGEPVTAHTRNIGVGGAFIATPDAPGAGTLLRLDLTIPGVAPGDLADVRAEVRWLARDDHELGAGMGVRFYGLHVDELLALSDYLSALTPDDRARRAP